MAEKHDAYPAPSYIANIFRQGFGEPGSADVTNVTPIRAARDCPLVG